GDLITETPATTTDVNKTTKKQKQPALSPSVTSPQVLELVTSTTSILDGMFLDNFSV
ncbi:hypothetical protein WUBG_16338, partial [Wuchereria bancrofti]